MHETGPCDCGQNPDRVGVFAESRCEVRDGGDGQQRLSEWRSQNQAESSSIPVCFGGAEPTHRMIRKRLQDDVALRLAGPGSAWFGTREGID